MSWTRHYFIEPCRVSTDFHRTLLAYTIRDLRRSSGQGNLMPNIPAAHPGREELAHANPGLPFPLVAALLLRASLCPIDFPSGQTDCGGWLRLLAQARRYRPSRPRDRLVRHRAAVRAHGR